MSLTSTPPKGPTSEWSKTSEHHYQRRMGENEQLIRGIGDRAHRHGREQWSVSAIANFAFEATDGHTSLDLGQKMREAWVLLRFQHPSIASRATDEQMLQYSAPVASGDLDAWLKESFFEITDPDVDADTLIAGLQPSPVATLHYLVTRSQVVLHTAHWRTEGYGAFQLIDALFTCMASAIDASDSGTCLPWGEEVACLVPGLESALGIPEIDPSAVAPPEIHVLAVGYLLTGRYLVGGVGLYPPGDPTDAPRGTRHVSIVLPHDITAALEASCVGKRIDLYTAIHAGVAAVNHARAPAEERKKHHVSTVRLDLRPHLLEPYRTPSVASGFYTGGYSVRLEAGQSFLKHARKLQKEYTDEPGHHFLACRRQYGVVALAAVMQHPNMPPVSNIDVSFVRGVDDVVKSRHQTSQGVLQVSELGLGVETTSRQTFCFYWKFRGQLNLSMWYNEAYYDRDDMVGVLRDLRDTLVRELA